MNSCISRRTYFSCRLVKRKVVMVTHTLKGRLHGLQNKIKSAAGPNSLLNSGDISLPTNEHCLADTK